MEKHPTCDGQPVQVGVRTGVGTLSGDVVPQAHSRQRDEAEVHRVQEAPVFLQVGEDPGWDEDEEQGRGPRQTDGVQGGHFGPGQGPSALEVGQGTVGQQVREPLRRHGQEEERDGDAQEAEEDAKGLAPIGERNHVTVA